MTEQQSEQVGGIKVPDELDASAYEGLRMAILHQVEQGLDNVLLGLSEETEFQLVGLAYHDLLRLERLERVIKDAMTTGGYLEAAVRKFNLGTYRRAATQTRKQIQDDSSRRAKMRERNLHLIQGGKAADRRTGTDVEVDEGSNTGVQAMVQSGSIFLRSHGLLEMFRKGRIWFDDFHGDYFTDWDGGDDDRVIPSYRIDDAFQLRAHKWLLMLDNKLGNASTSNTRNVLHAVADMEHRNGPRDWIKSLQWDKTERLPTLLSNAYGTTQDDYHAAVGRCWFVSMAARICDPGCKVDTMPVLYGPQGKSKSMSLEIIGGELYVSINTSASSNDFLGLLRGHLVAEIPELDAICGDKVDNSRVKALLSTRVDTYRPPYGHTARDFKRTVVIVGTTNDAGWHRDETGGRRFWPFNCAGSIDLQWLRDNREQLFAEAYARYARGELWWDVPKEAQEEQIAAHYSADPWEDKLREALNRWRIYRGAGGRVKPQGYVEPELGDSLAAEEGAHWGTLVTTNRLMTQALQIAGERQTRNTAGRVARTMRALGWDQQTVRVKSLKQSVTIRAWVVTPKSGEQEAADGELPLSGN